MSHFPWLLQKCFTSTQRNKMRDTTHVARSTKASELTAQNLACMRVHASVLIVSHATGKGKGGVFASGVGSCFRCWVFRRWVLFQVLGHPTVSASEKMVSAVPNPGCSALNHVDLTVANTPTQARAKAEFLFQVLGLASGVGSSGVGSCFRCWVIPPSQLLKKMVSAVPNPGCSALNHVDLTVANTPTSMQCPTHSMLRAGKRAKERAVSSLQTCCPRCQITVWVAPMVPWVGGTMMARAGAAQPVRIEAHEKQVTGQQSATRMRIHRKLGQPGAAIPGERHGTHPA